MAIRELRICDVCETEYQEGNPAWMIMTAPNAPSGDGQGLEFDFCSFDCLHSWVTSPDEGELAPGDTVDEEQPETDSQPDGYNPQTKAFEDRPPMTLAEAMAHGLKPAPHGS